MYLHEFPGIGRKMALKFAQMRATVVIWDIFEAGMQQTGSNSLSESLSICYPLMKTCTLFSYTGIPTELSLKSVTS